MVTAKEVVEPFRSSREKRMRSEGGRMGKKGSCEDVCGEEDT